MELGFRRTALSSCLFFLFIHRMWSTELQPPKDINVSSSVLTWDSSGDGNVSYTVEYSTVSVQDWHNVCGCNQTQFPFGNKDFYGKRFRIRAERANQTTDWQLSDTIQCKHTDTCAPQLNLVKTTMVLWMDDKDKTLEEVHGGHLTYKVLYWKETSAKETQVLPSKGKTVRLQGLESGEKYCFQVQYMLYSKPYGSPSRVLCEVIPETSTARIVISGVLIVGGLVVFGCCLYFVYKNYKRIKTFLQPPLEIPQHIEEFICGDFPHPKLVDFSSPELDSYDLISLELEVEEDQSGGRENSTCPDTIT